MARSNVSPRSIETRFRLERALFARHLLVIVCKLFSTGGRLISEARVRNARMQDGERRGRRITTIESRRFGGSKPAIKDTAFLPGPDALRPLDLRESSVEAEARKSIERNTALPSEKFRRDTISLLRTNQPTGRTLTHSRSALPPPLCPPLRPPRNAISPSGTSAFQVKLPLAVLPRRCEITRGTRTRDSILAALFPLPAPSSRIHATGHAFSIISPAAYLGADGRLHREGKQCYTMFSTVQLVISLVNPPIISHAIRRRVAHAPPRPGVDEARVTSWQRGGPLSISHPSNARTRAGIPLYPSPAGQEFNYDVIK